MKTKDYEDGAMCKTCGGDGVIIETYVSELEQGTSAKNCSTCHGTGKAPESPEAEATEPWISNHGFQPTHPGSSKCTDCPSKKAEHLYPAPDPAPQPQQNAGELDKHHTKLQIEIAAQLGYAPDEGYCTWRRVEKTAPVQEVHRLEALIARRELAAVELFAFNLKNMAIQSYLTPKSYGPGLSEKDIAQALNQFKEEMK